MNILDVFIFVCGAVSSAVVTRALLYHLVVFPLQRSHERYFQIAGKAQTDVRLVKALRAGEIGLDELKEVGVLDDLDVDAASPTLTLGEPTALPGSKPRFVPNFYKRAPLVANLAPGDEVWLPRDRVFHDDEGLPVVYADCVTSVDEARLYCVRLRVFEDGTLELGIRPNEEISGEILDSELDRLIVARVVNLDTNETRELPQVTDRTQLDT